MVVGSTLKVLPTSACVLGGLRLFGCRSLPPRCSKSSPPTRCRRQDLLRSTGKACAHGGTPRGLDSLRPLQPLPRPNPHGVSIPYNNRENPDIFGTAIVGC
jgi:hypothetical protein